MIINVSQDNPGLITIGEVGVVASAPPHEIYRVHLSIHDNITSKFLPSPQQVKVSKDIIKAYEDVAGDARILPKILKLATGTKDFIIDIKYLRCHLKMMFHFLSIYKFVFDDADGGKQENLRKSSATSKTIIQKKIFTSLFFQTNIFCTEIHTK